MSVTHRLCIAILSVFCATSLLAQTTQETATAITAVPRLVNVDTANGQLFTLSQEWYLGGSG